MMEKREFHTVMPLQQIDPDTGKVLRTFNSRLEAAVWIVENVLKRPEKNPISITGNMEMCIRSGWKAYGYYWKIIDVKTLMDTTAGNGTKIFGKTGLKVRGFDSINDVADYTGISRKVIARKLTKTLGVSLEGDKGMLYIQPMNKEKKVLHYKNANVASKDLGLAASTVAKIVKNRATINNYTIVLDTIAPKKARYQLYKGSKKVGLFDTQDALAESIHVTRKVVYNALQKNSNPLGYGYSVKKV